MTGDAPLRVVPEDVQAIGRYAADVAEQLKSGAGSLDGEVQALFGTWQGSAADAYRTGWDEMRDGVLQTFDALSDLAAKLGASVAAQQEQETSSSATLLNVD
ncbi:WXG100 family type VII secretion target [Nocardia sp. NPDC057227]|uniref:WXG100 family type VII secretion target n=1 Tax=Nocardia sp. NPDC057227 TaxID=3346056 RepID=UPI0036310F31